MKRDAKEGFTIVELAVVLVIIAILFSMAVPSLSGYIHRSQFKKNNSYAKTTFLAVESTLTHYRASGQWEKFRLKVLELGTENTDGDLVGVNETGKIYAICLDKGECSEGELKDDAVLVDRLIGKAVSDGELLHSSVAIEIDVDSGHVYSVFYSTHSDGFSYDAVTSNKYDMTNRDKDSRFGMRVGYYSADSVTNDVKVRSTGIRSDVTENPSSWKDAYCV